MRALSVSLLAILPAGCASMQSRRPTVSILVDLDPASADRTVIVESVTADNQGRLYTADWVLGNIVRVDPKAPKPGGRSDLRDGHGQIRLRPRLPQSVSQQRALSVDVLK